MSFELLIFDLDGTLIDTRQDIADAANEMLAHLGLDEKSVDEITGYVGDGITRLVECCVGDRRVDLEEAIAFFKRSYATHLLDTTAPYPGIIDLLNKLGGVKKALLTNKAYDMSRTITDELGLTDFFEVIVGGDTFPRRKPHPDGVQFILEKMGAAKERTLLVGDGRNDILTAENAGIRSVWVSWGFSDSGGIAGLNPDFTVHNAEELGRLVELP